MNETQFLDLDSIDPEQLVFYKKETDRGGRMITLHFLHGVYAGGGNIHKQVAFNKFEAVPTRILDGYEPKDRPSDDYIKQYVFNPISVTISPIIVPEYNQQSYFTHDNGGRPFLVYLSDDNVCSVYMIPTYKDDCYLPEDLDYREIDKKYYQKLVIKTEYTRVYIGKSVENEITEYGRGYGDEFDGNSILAQLSDLEYLYIGKDVKKIRTTAPIVEYVSSVGNNDVVYPYAVDSDGKVYLLIEDVCMCVISNTRDPYIEFYEKNVILGGKRTRRGGGTSSDSGGKTYGGFISFRAVDERGDEKQIRDEENEYTLRWRADPHFFYNRSKEECPYWYLEKEDGSFEEMTMDVYISLISTFGAERGFSPLVYETIQERV